MGPRSLKSLKKEGPMRIIIPKYKEIDPRDQTLVLSNFYRTESDLGNHLAGRGGGIGETRSMPAEIFMKVLE